MAIEKILRIESGRAKEDQTRARKTIDAGFEVQWKKGVVYVEKYSG